MAEDSTMLFSSDDELEEKNKGGRPQSVIREFFTPFYVDTTKRGRAKDNLSDISSYVCKDCHVHISGKSLMLLQHHAERCEAASTEKRGMFMFTVVC